jgi:hypothetical protein
MANFWRKLWWIEAVGLLALLTVLASCSPAPETEPTAVVETPISGEPLLPQSGQVRQWAAGAEASSEFATPEWAALQAVGEPDTLRCGDYPTAWATAGSDTVETLVLTYTQAVHVTGVNIIQSFNPNQVVQVELLGTFGRATTIYAGQPYPIDQPCPFTLAIPVERTKARFDRLRITVDQSVLGLGWNEIDAVELIGELE